MVFKYIFAISASDDHKQGYGAATAKRHMLPSLLAGIGKMRYIGLLQLYNVYNLYRVVRASSIAKFSTLLMLSNDIQDHTDYKCKFSGSGADTYLQIIPISKANQIIIYYTYSLIRAIAEKCRDDIKLFHIKTKPDFVLLTSYYCLNDDKNNSDN